MRAITGVSVSIGLGPSAASASSTACMSGAALGGCVAVTGGGDGGAALGELGDCAAAIAPAPSNAVAANR